MILNFPSSRIIRKELLLFISHPVSGTLLQQPQVRQQIILKSLLWSVAENSHVGLGYCFSNIVCGPSVAVTCIAGMGNFDSLPRQKEAESIQVGPEVYIANQTPLLILHIKLW